MDKIKEINNMQPFETDLKTNREHGDKYEYGYLYACPKCMTVKLIID